MWFGDLIESHPIIWQLVTRVAVENLYKWILYQPATAATGNVKAWSGAGFSINTSRRHLISPKLCKSLVQSVMINMSSQTSQCILRMNVNNFSKWTYIFEILATLNRLQRLNWIYDYESQHFKVLNDLSNFHDWTLLLNTIQLPPGGILNINSNLNEEILPLSYLVCRSPYRRNWKRLNWSYFWVHWSSRMIFITSRHSHEKLLQFRQCPFVGPNLHLQVLNVSTSQEEIFPMTW